MINLESNSEKTILEEDPSRALDNDPCSVPQFFITYAKHKEIRRLKALALLREKQAEELRIKLAQE